MAGQTPRFQLSFFGADTPGSIDDDGSKYTSDDRLLIDQILAAFEKHNHHLTPALDEPSDEPQLALGTGGALEAGTTYSYVVSFVDADGLESVSGPEVSIDTPDLLETPDPPAGETSTVTGNTLAPGLYYYALTGLRDGEESPIGEAFLLTVLDDENTATLTLPDLGDATTYQVWRQKDTDPGWTRVGTSATGTFTDDGSVPAGIYGDPDNIPPTTSTGVSSYTVTITLTGADLTAVQTASAWRIYRSETSGLYSATSLVHEVVERTDDLDETSPLLTSWIDDGDAPFTGTPKLYSTQLDIPPYTIEIADPLPAAAGYPDGYPILDGAGVLYVAKAGAWTPVAGTGGGGGSSSQVKGPWDASTTYAVGDVVTDRNHLWQATAIPTVGSHPTDVDTPITPYASFDGSHIYRFSDDGLSPDQATQPFMIGAAHDLKAIDYLNYPDGTPGPVTITFYEGGTTNPPLATATVPDASTLAIGWTTMTLSATVSLLPGHQYYAIATGSGMAHSLCLCDNVAGSGLSADGGVYYPSDFSQRALTRYMALRLYDSVPSSIAWVDLGRFIPAGAGATFFGHGIPDPEPDGAETGDIYFDLDNGDVYSLAGPN